MPHLCGSCPFLRCLTKLQSWLQKLHTQILPSHRPDLLSNFVKNFAYGFEFLLAVAEAESTLCMSCVAFEAMGHGPLVLLPTGTGNNSRRISLKQTFTIQIEELPLNIHECAAGNDFQCLY